MQYINTATGVSAGIYDIRKANPSMSIPDGADLLELGYESVAPVPLPALAPGESVVPGPLERMGKGWRETWVVLPAPGPEVIAEAKRAALWQAADSYTTSYISGVAIGILTIGVMLGKPKCSAVAAWSGGVWADYYGRKERVTADSVDDLDFSNHGPMPYSVPELQAEVGM